MWDFLCKVGTAALCPGLIDSPLPRAVSQLSAPSPQHPALSLALSAGPRANSGALPAHPAPLAAPAPGPCDTPASPSSARALSPAQPRQLLTPRGVPAIPTGKSIPPARPQQGRGSEGCRGLGFWGLWGLTNGRCRPPTGGRSGAVRPPRPHPGVPETWKITHRAHKRASRMEKLSAKPVL